MKRENYSQILSRNIVRSDNTTDPSLTSGASVNGRPTVPVKGKAPASTAAERAPLSVSPKDLQI